MNFNISQSQNRVNECVSTLHSKAVKSTTLERFRLMWEADKHVKGLPQPLQLGEGLSYLLNHISVPVSQNDLILGRILEETPDLEGEAFFQTRLKEWPPYGMPPWLCDVGHDCFAWEKLLSLGLNGLETGAKNELARRQSIGQDQARLDFLRGAIRIYQAFRVFAHRYATAAQEAGLKDCAAIADHPPATFADSLQLIWLVSLVYTTMVSPNSAISFGRLDELLLEYYNRDINGKCLSRQEAGDLIEDFYCKTNLILGHGEHQMGAGSEKNTGWDRNFAYDTPLYIVLAGRRRDASKVANDLTELFIERIVPQFKNPVIILRHTHDLPKPIWQLACDKMRANASVHIFNDEKIIPAMIHSGIEPNDAITYTMHGCNEPDIPGIQRMAGWSFDHSFSLPKYFLDALFSVDDNHSDIDGIYQQFTALLRKDIHKKCNNFREIRSNWDTLAPGVLRVDDCFLDGPVDGVCSWDCGGLKYRNLFFALYSIATAADSFAAVEDLVFRSKKVSLRVLKKALKNDFKDGESLRQLCLNAPKFGQDDDRVDKHAVRILKIISGETDRASKVGSESEVIVFRCLYSTMNHVQAGSLIGATPDGRHSGRPISENMSPSPGACKNGITATLNSIVKLPLDHINTGILNLCVQPKLFSGEEGLSRLMSLLQAFFERGGLQAQLSFVDTQELLDAQVNPAAHRNLMVRITGYSAAFTEMTKRAQDEFIRREEFWV